MRKPKTVKQSLALPGAKFDTVSIIDICRKAWPVPDLVSKIRWILLQYGIDLRQLILGEFPRATGALFRPKGIKALFIGSLYPAGNGSLTDASHLTDLRCLAS